MGAPLILVQATINLRSFPVGTMRYVDPTDRLIAELLGAGFLVRISDAADAE